MNSSDQHLLDDSALTLLEDLDALRVPMWVARHCRDYDGVTHTDEFTRPHGWQHTLHYGNLDRLILINPGDAICANMGHGGVAVVDVDPQNGGDIEAVRAALRDLDVTVYAEIATPGGGVHDYVADPGVHPVSGRKWGAVRDLPGVDVQVAGTNVFLPGSCRPKYGGHGYTVVFNRLADLLKERQAVSEASRVREMAWATAWPLRPGHRAELDAILADYTKNLRQIGGADRLSAWLLEHCAREVLPRNATKPRGLGVLAQRRRRAALARTVTKAERGNRNNTLLWAACRVVEDGSMTGPEDAVWMALAEAAADAGLEDAEIVATLHSALNTATEDR